MKSFDPLQLIGKTLKDGWVISSLSRRSSDATGANHSYGYIAHNKNGDTGFVKALKVELDTRIEDKEERLADLQTRI